MKVENTNLVLVTEHQSMVRYLATLVLNIAAHVIMFNSCTNNHSTASVGTGFIFVGGGSGAGLGGGSLEGSDERCVGTECRAAERRAHSVSYQIRNT